MIHMRVTVKQVPVYLSVKHYRRNQRIDGVSVPIFHGFVDPTQPFLCRMY